METKITKKTFGALSTGEEAHIFTLEAGALRLSLTNYGGTLLSLFAPDREGRLDDILLGYSALEPYTRKGPFFGATIGRFANRIGGARFTLGGREYRLCDNDGNNCLHGGRRGFDKRLWEAQTWAEADFASVRLLLESPAGEEGFPGNLKAQVTYTLTADGRLIADYAASVDAPCPVNLTNHAYFNLGGEGSGSIYGHEARLFSSYYVPVDNALIPTGELAPVSGTAFDFTVSHAIGRNAGAAGGGYDHSFVIDGKAGEERPFAEVFDRKTGRGLSLSATTSAVQFYTANMLGPELGKNGSIYERHGGFCLETGGIPDAPNKKEFPSSIYGPERPYHERAEFKFWVKK